MKKIFCILIMFLLAGCSPVAERVMPPLQYTKPISLHIQKTAYLNWQSGTNLAYVEPTYLGNADPVAAIIVSAVDTQNRKANPGHYTFTYGTPQQVVFMTSLKNILIQHDVFNDVKLIAEPPKLKSNDTLITVKFRSTRVGGMGQEWGINLIVDLSIQAVGQKPFNRAYSVHSKPPADQFTIPSYVDLQTNVSQQLLEKILSGLEEWNTQLKKGK